MFYFKKFNIIHYFLAIARMRQLYLKECLGRKAERLVRRGRYGEFFEDG
jgi:hypothetical protein